MFTQRNMYWDLAKLFFSVSLIIITKLFLQCSLKISRANVEPTIPVTNNNADDVYAIKT